MKNNQEKELSILRDIDKKISATIDLSVEVEAGKKKLVQNINARGGESTIKQSISELAEDIKTLPQLNSKGITMVDGAEDTLVGDMIATKQIPVKRFYTEATTFPHSERDDSYRTLPNVEVIEAPNVTFWGGKTFNTPNSTLKKIIAPNLNRVGTGWITFVADDISVNSDIPRHFYGPNFTFLGNGDKSYYRRNTGNYDPIILYELPNCIINDKWHLPMQAYYSASMNCRHVWVKAYRVQHFDAVVAALTRIYDLRVEEEFGDTDVYFDIFRDWNYNGMAGQGLVGPNTPMLIKDRWDYDDEPVFANNKERAIYYFKRNLLHKFRMIEDGERIVTFPKGAYDVLTSDDEIVTYLTEHNWTIVNRGSD